MVAYRWGVGWSVVAAVAAGAFACDGQVDVGGPVAAGPSEDGGLGNSAFGNVGAADAGSLGDAPPTPDGHVVPVGTSCDLPGRWAAQVMVKVDWAETSSVAAGGGSLIETLLVDRASPSANQLSESVTVCSLAYPDFYGRAGTLTDGYQWGIQPVRAPDGITFQTTGVSTSASSGTQAVFDPLEIIVGAAFAHPGDAWSPAPGPGAVDVDHDGFPGITLASKQGPTPTAPPPNYDLLVSSNTLGIKKIDRVYASLRTAFTLHGSLSGCDTLSGGADVPLSTAGVPELDRRVYGCIYQGHQGSEPPGTGTCNPTETAFLDDNLPVLTPHASGTLVEKRIADGATCDDALAAFKSP